MKTLTHAPLVSFFLALCTVLSLSPGAFARTPQTAHTSPKDLNCQATYKKIFSKGVVRIRMAFGYKDTRPARFVGDRHERLAFVERILRPCKGQRLDCGFRRHPDNGDLFGKLVPGLDGKPVRILLYVTHSSVGSDDLSNRQDPYQVWQSNYAKKSFYSGIEKADIVFYNGHSRFGGGPDFEPPHLTDDDQPNVKYYQSHRPGFQIVKEQLKSRAAIGSKKKSDQGLRLLGLFSCASSQLFAKTLEKEYETGLISSRALIYYADALESSLRALSALLEMRCEKDFKAAVGHPSPVKDAHVHNFFLNK